MLPPSQMSRALPMQSSQKPGEEGLHILFGVHARVFVGEAGIVFRRAVAELFLELLHELRHRGDLAQVAGIYAERLGVNPLAPVEQEFEKPGGIEPAVRPGRLHSRNEIFDAADHRIVIYVLFFVPVFEEGGDVHPVVHQGGIPLSPCR